MFYKMHVCGNDFLVIDAISNSLEFSPEKVRRWSDRRKGIGFDQMLVVVPPATSQQDFFVQIVNGDGSVAEQCGNGCAAVCSLLRHLQLTEQSQISLGTLGGDVACEFAEPESSLVTVQLPPPSLNPKDVPFIADNSDYLHRIQLSEPVDKELEVVVLSMGNPHAVIFVENVDAEDLQAIGTALQHHERFPNSVNVELVQVCDRRSIRIRIFERGVGETLACGSGSCAAMVSARLQNRVDRCAILESRGGSVAGEWLGMGEPVRLTCSPELVFEGRGIRM